MSRRFFKPFVGFKYDKGINGKRILVLGASFYCDGKKDKCKFFSDCTNPLKKDSSRFDRICPEYAENGLRLSKEPLNAISGNDVPIYQVFANFMRQFVDDKEEDVWQRMAFTNYVQFFVPTVALQPVRCPKSGNMTNNAAYSATGLVRELIRRLKT